MQEEGSVWERGVEIYARPPGKKLQNISQLSGGEQSLTAIAHLFSALEVAKMPLAVLDEVDAALDEYNLIRFADLAKEYSRSLQLIVMTYRRTTMERDDLIYGGSYNRLPMWTEESLTRRVRELRELGARDRRAHV